MRRRRTGVAQRSEVCPQKRREDRTAGLRSAARMGLLAPAGTLVYAALTWNGPRRPALVAVSLVLAVIAGTIWAAAGPLSCSRRRWQVGVAAILVQLAGMAALSYLDGGVSSPLGALVYLSLPLVAITVSTRLFLPFAGYATALYLAVALLGGPAAPGHVYGFTMTFLGVAMFCAAHTQSLSSLRQRLTEVARVDPLTSSLNRRGFDERVREEIRRVDRVGGTFSLVLVDLDAFKAVNDTHGHQVGDTVLIWTTDTLRRAARPTDDVARSGGDEFAVLLRGADPAGAAAFVRRLRVVLDATAPASMGTASYPVEAGDAHAMFKLADDRLYDDKEARADQPAATLKPPPARTAKKGRGPVSSLERRRRAVADGGYVAMACWLLAIAYILLLAADDAPRSTMLLLCATGIVIGAGLVAAARWIASTSVVNPLLLTYTGLQIALTIVATVLDGGLASPMSLGLLAPLPLIALSTPLRLALPISSVMGVAYLVIGTVVGAPSEWYAIMNLLGVLTIAVACAAAGHLAAEQRQQLTMRSRIDWVTDCLNRRGFEQRFERASRCTAATAHPLSLVIVDLDSFKQVNDTQGHAAGDDLLRWVGATMQQILPDGAVGRLGGDEFVALLTDHPDDAAALVDRIRQTLAQRTAASVGLATTGAHGEGFDALYRHADAMLYAEKAAKCTTLHEVALTSAAPTGSGASALIADAAIALRR